MIFIILYIWYLIISFTYKEYKINSHIEYITQLNIDIEKNIKLANKIIEYKTSKAYKNKMLKEQQSRKNDGELVIYLTSQEKYNKFTAIKDENIIEEIKIETNHEKNIKEMSIYQKWMYLIFDKDLSI